MRITKPSSSKLQQIGRILKVSWQVRKWALIGYFAGAILETAMFIVLIYATAQLSNLLAHYGRGSHTGSIWFWLWVDVIGGTVTALAFLIMSSCKRLLYFRTVAWATQQFHLALSRIDIADYYDDEIRNQINKAQAGYTWQLSNFNEATLDLVYGIIRFVATAIVVAQITWWLIPLIVVFLLPSLLVENKRAKVQWFVWDQEGDTRHIYWGLENMLRQVKNQMELRSAQARGYVLDKLGSLNGTFYRQQEREFRRFGQLSVPAKILEAGGSALGSIVVLRQFLASTISLDRYFFLSGALLRIGGALNNIFGTLSRMQEQFLFIENYFAVIDLQPKLVDKTPAVELANQVPYIRFEHVDFTYPGQKVPVFKDLDFSIMPGEHVALVGENGAGKSTLIKLLLRFYRPTSGRILINEIDLQDVQLESWYGQLATLFQDFNQYPFPVNENIEIGRPEKAGNKQRLKQAAEFSNVDTMVKNYPHGWDTVLDNSFEKGTEPSGGQWQRVALARAIYRHANLLILDEPTSAIDAKAEYDIFNNIFNHYRGKSALIVSHRFSTVRRANRIIVIDKGMIIEEGSHTELMKRSNLYKELFSKQAEGYKD